MRSTAGRVTSDVLLLVEGQDEVNLLAALLKDVPRRGAAASAIQILAAGGRTRFRKELKALVVEVERSGRSLRAVGILRDADENPAAAFQSVSDAVRAAGLTPPPKHGQFSNDTPAVGIFIIPDGASPGAIETLCLRSVAGTRVARCVKDYIACLEQDGDSRSSASIDKTFAHAYLAAGPNPVARVGEGAQAGAWDLDHAAFAALRGFVTELARRGI